MPGGRTLPNLGLKGFFDLGEDGWDDEMNLNLLKLSLLTQGGVSAKVAALPNAPAEGDAVILDETAGDHANAVAVYDAAAWVYFTPVEGWLLYDRAADHYLKFNGALWEVLATGGGGGGGIEDAPEDGKLYGRRDAAWDEVVTAAAGPLSVSIDLPFLNGWYSENPAVEHRCVKTGRTVILYAHIKGVDYNAKVFQLPEGWRPAQSVRATIYEGAGDLGYAVVNPDGSVYASYVYGDPTQGAVINMAFAVPAQDAWNGMGALGGDAASLALDPMPAFQNGWVEYGGDYDTVRVEKAGRVVTMTGIIKSGAPGQPAFTLPVGWRPAGVVQCGAMGGGYIAYATVRANGEFVPDNSNQSNVAQDYEFNLSFVVPEEDAYNPVSAGGGGGAVRKVAEIDLGGLSTYTFDDLPQNGQAIEIVVTGSMDGPATDLGLRCNGDAGADQYDVQRTYANQPVQGGGVTSQDVHGTTFVTVAFAGTDYPNAGPGILRARFDNYRTTDRYKTMMFEGRQPTNTGYAYVMHGTGQWRGNDAIGSLTVFSGSGGNFKPGTTATVYVVGAPETGGGSTGGYESGGDLVNGWRKTPDGFIENWGLTSAAQGYIPFMKPFEEGCIGVWGSAFDGNPDGGVGMTFHLYADPPTLEGFTYRSTYQVRNESSVIGAPVRWFAKGR